MLLHLLRVAGPGDQAALPGQPPVLAKGPMLVDPFGLDAPEPEWLQDPWEHFAAEEGQATAEFALLFSV